MSVHLVGGGREADLAPAIYGAFVAEASSHAAAAGRPIPRIGVVVVAGREDLAAGVAWFAEVLARCGAVDVLGATATEEPATALRGVDGVAVSDSWFAALDGLVVGGGLTPAYHRVLLPHAAAIRSAVLGGLPYAGFSAGAVLAATRALLGGWRLGSIAVTHEDNAEDLDQITVAEGLGLVPMTIEVHTAQWGTLSRVVAAADAGATGSALAIDENTVVIVDATSDSSVPAPDLVGARFSAGMQVRGAGQAWLIGVSDGRVQIERRPAG